MPEMNKKNNIKVLSIFEYRILFLFPQMNMVLVQRENVEVFDHVFLRTYTPFAVYRVVRGEWH